MTTYPGAKFRPLAPEQGQPRMVRHDIVLLGHVLPALAGHDQVDVS